MCGFHWCHEETLALLMVLPFTRAIWVQMRAWLHRRSSKKPACGHAEHTCHPHVDLEVTGPPGITIRPGTVVVGVGAGTPLKLAEVVTLGPDGRAEVAVEVGVAPREAKGA